MECIDRKSWVRWQTVCREYAWLPGTWSFALRTPRNSRDSAVGKAISHPCRRRNACGRKTSGTCPCFRSSPRIEVSRRWQFRCGPCQHCSAQLAHSQDQLRLKKRIRAINVSWMTYLWATHKPASISGRGKKRAGHGDQASDNWWRDHQNNNWRHR